MMRFKTVLKNNWGICLLGVAMVAAGDFLPIREMQLWDNVKISANLVQILGFIFSVIPLFIWHKGNRRK